MSNNGGVSRRQVEKLAAVPVAERQTRLSELGELLSNEDPYVQRRAIELIVEVAEAYPGQVADIIEPVAQQLGNDVIQGDAARVVAAVAASEPATVKERLPLLVAVLDTGGSVTAHVTDALVAISDSDPEALAQPGIVEQLRGQLTTEEPKIRTNVTGVLGDIAAVDPEKVRQAVEDLRDCLDDSVKSVRRNAVYALAELADITPQSVLEETEQLSQLLESEDADVRAGATAALAAAASQTVEKETASLLVDQLWDDSTVVREQAAFTLANLARTDPGLLESHIRQLTRGLADSDPRVRRNLLSALERLEEPFPEAIASARTQVGDALATVDPEDSTTDVTARQLRGLADEQRAPDELTAAAREALYSSGSDVSKACPNCGEQFEPDATFCSVCGTSLE